MEHNEPLQQGGPQPEPAHRSSHWGELRGWIRDLLIASGLALVIIVFLYQPVKVEGTSMMPSLVDQERIFINKFIYRFGLGNIERGDLVVFWFPGDQSKSYIKRVIGLPGDTIASEAGVVYVNGQPRAEPYVPEEFRDRHSRQAPGPRTRWFHDVP